MFRTQSWRDVSPGEVGMEEFYDLFEHVDTIVDDVPGVHAFEGSVACSS